MLAFGFICQDTARLIAARPVQRALANKRVGGRTEADVVGRARPGVGPRGVELECAVRDVAVRGVGVLGVDRWDPIAGKRDGGASGRCLLRRTGRLIGRRRPGL